MNVYTIKKKKKKKNKCVLKKKKKKEREREILDHSETGESNYFPISFRNMPHRRATDTEPMDRILL